MAGNSLANISPRIFPLLCFHLKEFAKYLGLLLSATCMSINPFTSGAYTLSDIYRNILMTKNPIEKCPSYVQRQKDIFAEILQANAWLEKFEHEMSIRILPTTLVQIFCKIIPYSRDIV